MRKNQFLFFALLLVVVHGYGQHPNFITEGRIEFEKKINLYSQFNDDDSWTAEFKKNIPQFKTTYFDLLFTDAKTFYKPGRENTDNNRLWEQPAENNIVYPGQCKNHSLEIDG